MSFFSYSATTDINRPAISWALSNLLAQFCTYFGPGPPFKSFHELSNNVQKFYPAVKENGRPKNYSESEIGF